MFENRSLRLDLVALGLFALTVFLAFSLASYDPADPVGQILVTGPLSQVYQPDMLVFPPNERIHNACGRWGALAADLLLNGLGIGAYYVVFTLGALDVTLLRRRPLDAPLLRVVGWLASLVGGVSLAAIFLPNFSPGPVIGSGGYLGALGRAFIEGHFATLGGVILCGSLILGGLLLCTDYLVVRMVAMLGSATYMAFDSHRRVWARGRESRRTAPGPALKPLVGATGQEDVYEPDNSLDEDGETMSVRIRRKRASDLDNAAAASGASDRQAAGKLLEKNSEKPADKSPVKTPEPAVAKPAARMAPPLGKPVKTPARITAEPAAVTADTAVARLASVAPLAQFDADSLLDDEPDDLVVVAGKTPAAKSSAPPLVPVLVDDDEDDASHVKVRRNADAAERDRVRAELEEASQGQPAEEYELPSIDLLVEGEGIDFEQQEKEVRRKAKILEKTFLDFGFKVRVVEIETGPVIGQYEVELEAGLRLSKITCLADDLAIALRVPSVRIVAPIPGKNTVGIEVPNEERQTVRLREVIEESNAKVKKMRIPLFLGKDVSGNALTADLSTLPHLLIAGRTGTGKSVCLNAIITSILMTRRPDEVRMLMIDPKMVELSGYGRLPHLMHPVVTDMRKAEAILAWAVEKMEERYALLARAGVRHISNYNQLGEEELVERLQPEDDEARKAIPLQLPFIVIVADEIADMMMTAGKEVEQHIIRLAQKSRAVGIHLILATQKPTVDVITGLIKSNLPARISFQVASRVDSRVVLDEMGADKLLGNGDMLFLWPGTSTLLRGQGTYLGDDEINKVVDHCSRSGQQNFVSELVNMKVQSAEGEPAGIGQLKKRDDLYESAVDIVVREGRGSVSLLQRSLGVGYGRAARLIDFMAEDGIVGQYNGSQAREILISVEDWERMQGMQNDAEAEAAPKKRSKKVKPEPDVEARESDVVVPGKRRRKKVDADAPWQDDEFQDEFQNQFQEDGDDAGPRDLDVDTDDDGGYRYDAESA